jgi:hypothetical protein
MENDDKKKLDRYRETPEAWTIRKKQEGTQIPHVIPNGKKQNNKRFGRGNNRDNRKRFGKDDSDDRW